MNTKQIITTFIILMITVLCASAFVSVPTITDGIGFQYENIIIGDDRIQIGSTNITKEVTFVIAASDSLHKEGADFVCDGINDEIEGIAAQDALPDVGGKIVYMAGNYNFSDEVVINQRTGVSIVGEGKGTVIRRADNMVANANPTVNPEGDWANLFRFRGCSYCSLEDMVLNGNYENQIYVNDGTHPADWVPEMTETMYTNVYFQSTTHSLIRNVKSYDAGTNNIRIGQSDYSILSAPSTYNIVENCETYGGRNGILIYGSATSHVDDYNIIRNNNCHEGLGFAGIYIYSSYTLIDGNHCWGFSAHDGIRLVGRSCNTIINNNCHDNEEYGILASTTNDTEYYNNIIYNNNYTGARIDDGCIFCGNRIFSNAGSGLIITGNNVITNDNYIKNSITYGILASGASDLTIHDNIVEECGCGILAYNAHRSSIEGNIIENCGLNAPYSRSYGIMIYGPSNDTIVSNNVCAETRNGAARTQTYGISLAVQNSTVIGNILENNIAGGILNTASTGRILGNIGYVTENSGTATLASGTTVKTIAHGLAVTPAAGDIMVTAMESLGSASFFWIDGYTATTFNVTVNADPTQDVDIAWSGIVL